VIPLSVSRTAIQAAIAFVLMSGMAAAECDLNIETIGASGKYTRFGSQVQDTFNRTQSDEPTAHQLGAIAGHILGQQAAYLGDSQNRRDWFDCIKIKMESELALAALAIQGDPRDADAVFQSALLGALTDEELEGYGVDLDAPVASIFDEDWTGTWIVQAQSKSVHKFKMGARLVFDMTGDPVVTLSKVSGGGTPETFPAAAAGEIVTFEHTVGSEHRYVWTLVFGEKACSGGIKTYGPNSEIEWDLISCARE